ncbi:MAG: FtsB family cell division protein [Actinomycetota bacterium]
MSSRTVSASRLRLTGRAVVLGVILILTGVASAGVVRQYLGQRAEIDRLEQEVRSIETDRERLEEELTRLHDPEHLERLARECLGMVKPGEIRFVVPDDSGTPPARC